MDHVVLDDPALGPVRADQARLVRGGRRPRAGGLRQLEAADGDEVEVVLGRVEDRAPHVDLDQLRVRVRALEVRPDRRRVVADLGVPHVPRLLRVPDPVGQPGPVVEHLGAQRRVRDLLQGRDLVEAHAVQVHVAEVLLRRVLLRVDDPVPVDLLGEGVEGAEQRVRHRNLPHRALDRLPSRHLLRALDDDVLARRRLVGDAPLVAQPAAPRPHPLAVHPLVDDDGVSRLGELRRAVDRPKRLVRRPVRGVGTGRSRHGTRMPWVPICW